MYFFDPIFYNQASQDNFGLSPYFYWYVPSIFTQMENI